MQKCIMLFYFYKRLTWWLFQLVTFLGKTFFVNPVPVALIEEGRSDSDDVGVGMSVADYVQPEVGSSGADDVKAEVDTSDDEKVLPCALQSTQPNETERDKRKPSHEHPSQTARSCFGRGRKSPNRHGDWA